MPTPKGTAAAKKAWDTRRAADNLPPHALSEEMGALSCILQSGNDGSQQNADAMLGQLRPNFFYDHRTRSLHDEIFRMRASNLAIDLVTLRTWLTNSRKPDGQLFNMLDEVGGWEFVEKVFETAPSAVNFPYYLPALKHFYLRRWCLAKQVRIGELANKPDVTPDELREEFAELYEASANIGAHSAPLIHVVSPAQARAFEPDPSDFLVGDGLITRGMIVTIGGDPGIGKSRLTTTLAIAGARGNNRWMNFPIRYQL